MEITICGHSKAAKILADKPGCLDVIMISSPSTFFAVKGSETIIGNAKSYKLLVFDDIPSVREGFHEPKIEHIQDALDFAQDKKELIVCCQAGVSRSSAVAYVIRAKAVGAYEALSVLNPSVHFPNSMVVELGSQILKKPDMVELVRIWKTKVG